MTDEELIARLRGWARDIQTGSTAIWAMDQDLKSAAARIEALAAEIERLEAKLAKAVEALEEIATDEHPLGWIAIAALAELKGRDDEWKCPINYTGCTKNCGSYGCGN